MMYGMTEEEWQRTKAREEAEHQRRMELSQPARDALKEALPGYHKPHMRTVDLSSFEAKADPVTAVVNLRADVRALEMTIRHYESELQRLHHRVDGLTFRPSWRLRLSVWLVRAKHWLRREDQA